jgi:hypothetical protein
MLLEKSRDVYFTAPQPSQQSKMAYVYETESQL